MARGFRNYGTDSGDDITTTVTSIGTQRSYAFWLYFVGAVTHIGGKYDGSVRDGRIRLADTNGRALNYFHTWSGALARWQEKNLATSTWQHITITYDGSDVGNDAVLYINGVDASWTTVTSPSGNFQTNSTAHTWGNLTASSSEAFDGMLAECALWNRVLSTGEIGGLADGYAPSFFPNGLLSYIPMVRDVVDYVAGAPSVNGAAVQDHPRIIVPAPVFYSIPSGAGSITGTLSGTLGAVTASSAGDLALDGTLAGTLGAVTASSAGELALDGTLAGTLDAVTSSAAGAVALDGAVSSTLSAVTVSGAGTLALDGTLTATLAAVTVSAAGSEPVTIDGAIAVTLAGQGPSLIVTGQQPEANMVGQQPAPGLIGLCPTPIFSGEQPVSGFTVED